VSTKSRTPSTAPGYDAKLALYEALVAANPEVERKGDTMPYTSVNGHMFSLLTKDGMLILRLPAEERKAFLEKYDSKLPVLYGAVMSEYVEVPDTLLPKTRELKKFFDKSYAYVASLKPKPAAKKKTG
jgi:TfoX/Sxy family transcriptional regulator of competence genes